MTAQNDDRDAERDRCHRGPAANAYARRRRVQDPLEPCSADEHGQHPFDEDAGGDLPAQRVRSLLGTLCARVR
jgi:hypothetical protein